MTSRTLVVFFILILSQTGESRRSQIKPAEASAVYDLHAAARSGNAKLVREILTSEVLLEEGIKVSPDAFAGEKAPLISTLEGRHEAFDSRLMRSTFDIEAYSTTITELLALGADPSSYCPTVEAITYRSVESLDILLSSMNASSVRDCIITIDGEGRSHWHLLAESPASGLTRILMRAGKMNLSDPETDKTHRIIKRELGISSLPVLSGPQQFLMKRSIEDALNLTDFNILVKAYLRSGGSASEFATEGVIAEKRGLSPLLLACQHGRPHVVRRFLQLKFFDAATSKSLGPASMTVTPPVGSTCAHLAALRGYVDVLTVLYEEQGLAALTATDASSRTPCDRVRGQGLLWKSSFDFLMSKGACVSSKKSSSSSSSSSSSAPDNRGDDKNRVDIVERAGLSLRYFDPQLHIQGGWNLLSNASLSRYNLPSDLFTSWNKTAENGIDIVANASDSKVVRRYRSQSRPFLGVAAFDPANVIGPDGWKRGNFISDFGALLVSASDVPYSTIYGSSPSTNYSIREFTEKYMGINSTESAQSMFINAEGELATTETSNNNKNNGSSNSIPYVFDSKVIPANVRRFVPFLHYLQEHNPVYEKNKDTVNLRQLGLGPPGSGAMPHYHSEAVNILLFGLKLWTVWAPQHAAFSGANARDFFEHALDGSAGGGGEFPSISFIQEPGDLVYLPSFYGHATLNLADSFSIAIE